MDYVFLPAVPRPLCDAVDSWQPDNLFYLRMGDSIRKAGEPPGQGVDPAWPALSQKRS